MKKIIISLSLLMAITATSFLLHMQDASETVRHVVVFKYKDGTKPADIEKVNDSFSTLQDKIPGIISFEYGINNSPEGKDQGFSHVYLVTFESAEARDAYLPHPEHKNFGNMLGSLDVLEDVFVVDYHPMD